ncbi:hypothetical protein BDF14DRAFT_608584 [Spinellus fusiger]|nr:hypothetical protein BDF14DRAFT_608584 [Spinellus fusiger]
MDTKDQYQQKITAFEQRIQQYQQQLTTALDTTATTDRRRSNSERNQPKPPSISKEALSLLQLLEEAYSQLRQTRLDYATDYQQQLQERRTVLVQERQALIKERQLAMDKDRATDPFVLSESSSSLIDSLEPSPATLQQWCDTLLMLLSALQPPSTAQDTPPPSPLSPDMAIHVIHAQTPTDPLELSCPVDTSLLIVPTKTRELFWKLSLDVPVGMDQVSATVERVRAKRAVLPSVIL